MYQSNNKNSYCQDFFYLFLRQLHKKLAPLSFSFRLRPDFAFVGDLFFLSEAIRKRKYSCGAEIISLATYKPRPEPLANALNNFSNFHKQVFNFITSSHFLIFLKQFLFIVY